MKGLKVSKDKNSFVADPGRPIFLSIESYKGMNKKQLERYVYGIAEKNVQSLRGCNYQIIKHEDGFIAEIHDGGNGYGVLQSVMRHLEDHNEAVVETASNRKIRILKKPTAGGFSYKSYALNDEDKALVTESVAYVDKLNPLITPGYALWRLSIALAVVGISTLFLGGVFKYIIYDTTNETRFINTGKEVPLKQLNELIIAKPQDGNYISALKYRDKKWSREEKALILPVASGEDKPTPEANTDVELNKLNSLINSSDKEKVSP